MSQSKKRIVCFIGCPGSGKSSIINYIATKLETVGKKVAVVSMDAHTTQHGKQTAFAHFLVSIKNTLDSKNICLADMCWNESARCNLTAHFANDKNVTITFRTLTIQCPTNELSDKTLVRDLHGIVCGARVLNRTTEANKGSTLHPQSMATTSPNLSCLVIVATKMKETEDSDAVPFLRTGRVLSMTLIHALCRDLDVIAARAVYDECRQNGNSSTDLTEDQLNAFQVGAKKIEAALLLPLDVACTNAYMVVHQMA